MSNLNSVYATALSGLSAASAQFDASAAKIAASSRSTTSGPTDPTGVVGPLTDLAREQAVYTANAAVLRAADRMTGTLLDVLDEDDRHEHADRWE